MEKHCSSELHEAEHEDRGRSGLAGPLAKVLTKPIRMLGGLGARVVRRRPSKQQQPAEAPHSEPQQTQFQPFAGLASSFSGLNRRPTTQAAQAGSFPCQLCTSPMGTAGPCQDIVTQGSRQWAWLGSALSVKIYDFALYVDPQKAKSSVLSKRYEGKHEQMQQQQLLRDLRSSGDIEMSLMVRASRNLPLLVLSKEYERILKRRLKVVGGSPKDPALKQILHSFDRDQLPPAILQGPNVKKGTVLTFTRDTQGNLKARANDTELVTVHSTKLASAVFDLYLGEQPVSKDAKALAADSVISMIDPAATYSRPETRGLCDGKSSSCKIALRN